MVMKKKNLKKLFHRNFFTQTSSQSFEKMPSMGDQKAPLGSFVQLWFSIIKHFLCTKVNGKKKRRVFSRPTVQVSIHITSFHSCGPLTPSLFFEDFGFEKNLVALLPPHNWKVSETKSFLPRLCRPSGWATFENAFFNKPSFEPSNIFKVWKTFQSLWKKIETKKKQKKENFQKLPSKILGQWCG